jgi:peptidylprolyl isomerase
MRLAKAALPVLLLLALAACGTPTDNSSTSTGQFPFNAEASVASGSVAPESSAAPAAEASPAAAGNVAAVDTASRNDKYSAVPQMAIDANKTYTATIETTKGAMKAELYAKEAPITVNSFVFLARDGYFQNIRFHRIIKDFMVQTGDPLGTGTGGPGYQFEDEPVTRSYTRGTLAMANAGPNTNGSQFFIVHQDYPLQPNYTIFGKVTEGLDVLDAIANTPVTAGPTGEPSSPTEEVLITNITIAEQ